MDDRVAWKIEPKGEFKGDFNEEMDSNKTLHARIVGPKKARGICFYSPFLFFILVIYFLFILYMELNLTPTLSLIHPLSTRFRGQKQLKHLL